MADTECGGACVPLRFLITAGPTREPIDPVRFVSNPASGRMGFALAQAAMAAGHTVHLITGPTCVEPPEATEVVRVTTAAQMRDAVLSRLGDSDVLIMAAAVADYRPKAFSEKKIRKCSASLTLPLERTTDILAECAAMKGDRVHVGFAAETEDVIDNARAKLEAKDLDIIVANDLTMPGAGFQAETNRATLLWRDGRIEALPLMTKADLAAHVVNAVVDCYGQ
jgi:phosphopantothenoylcysteine decarboxylase/phosphopantothenate--cysteine ligase